MLGNFNKILETNKKSLEISKKVIDLGMLYQYNKAMSWENPTKRTSGRRRKDEKRNDK